MLGFSIDGGSRNVGKLNTARERAPLCQSLRLSTSFKTPRDRDFLNHYPRRLQQLLDPDG